MLPIAGRVKWRNSGEAIASDEKIQQNDADGHFIWMGSKSVFPSASVGLLMPRHD